MEEEVGKAPNKGLYQNLKSKLRLDCGEQKVMKVNGKSVKIYA